MPLRKEHTPHELDRSEEAIVTGGDLDVVDQSYDGNERHARDLQRRLHAAYSEGEPSSESGRTGGRSTLGRIVCLPPIAMIITGGVYVAFVLAALLLVLPALIIEAMMGKAKPAL